MLWNESVTLACKTTHPKKSKNLERHFPHLVLHLSTEIFFFLSGGYGHVPIPLLSHQTNTQIANFEEEKAEKLISFLGTPLYLKVKARFGT